jgi:hypothetical protein
MEESNDEDSHSSKCSLGDDNVSYVDLNSDNEKSNNGSVGTKKSHSGKGEDK